MKRSNPSQADKDSRLSDAKQQPRNDRMIEADGCRAGEGNGKPSSSLAWQLQNVIYEASGMVDALFAITKLAVSHKPDKDDGFLPFTENQTFGLQLLQFHVMDRLRYADKIAHVLVINSRQQ